MTTALLTRGNDTTTLEQQRLPQGVGPQPAPVATTPTGNPLVVQCLRGDMLDLGTARTPDFPTVCALMCDCLQGQFGQGRLRRALGLTADITLLVAHKPAPMVWAYTTPHPLTLKYAIDTLLDSWRRLAGEAGKRLVVLDHRGCQHDKLDPRASTVIARRVSRSAGLAGFRRTTIGRIVRF